MTGACPPDGVLEQLLTDPTNGAEKQALEVHVAGCASCRSRIEHLNRGGLTLAAWPVGPAFEREDTPGNAGGLERATDPLPFKVPIASRQAAPGREIEAAAYLTPTPSSAGTVAPTSEPQDGAFSGPVAGSETPAPVQHTTEFTPHPAAENPTVRARADSASTPPAAFGRYQVQRALGAGGFGAVYLGHDTQLDRPVAIKVLRPESGRPQAEGDQALREARRLAQLRHPGIVAVHDMGMHEGRVYIVSDSLDGPDLGRWLAENRPAWPEAARIAAAVADAVAHAHARLIVHRDVKPANIILTADRVPVLVDFGLALDKEQIGGREKGLVSGTPWYMSPEQAAGAAHRIDGRTDIYSIGVVLYEMLTGRVPFRATNPLELLRQLHNDEPQPPRQLVLDIPPELERACLKALAKQQQDRYTTAADFAVDLRRRLPLTSEGPASPQRPFETSKSEPRASQRISSSQQILTPSSSRLGTREAERRQVTRHNASVTHRCYLSLTLWHLGYPDRAHRVDREMRELARTIGHPFSLGHAVDFTAFLYYYCRLGAEVITAAESEIAVGTEQGFQLWHALGTLHKGAGMLLQGRREEALPLLLKGFGAFRATGAEVRVPAYLSILGDAYTQTGRFEDALNALNEGLAIAEKNDDRCHEAELYRLKGELLLAESPDETAAEDWFRQAIGTALRQQSRAWELRATTSLARLWRRQGRHVEARSALAAVCGTYTEGFTNPDLVDAKKLLEALG